METPELSRQAKSKAVEYRIKYNSIKDSTFSEAILEALWSIGQGNVKKSDLTREIFIIYSYEDLVTLIKSHQQRLVADAEQLVACLFKVVSVSFGGSDNQ